jgi:hypothetical protein
VTAAVGCVREAERRDATLTLFPRDMRQSLAFDDHVLVTCGFSCPGQRIRALNRSPSWPVSFVCALAEARYP